MNANRRFSILGLAILGLVVQGLLPGCSRKTDGLDPKRLPDAPFAVETTLLGPAQADSVLGLIFRPPAGYQPGDPRRVAQIREMVRAQTKPGDPLANDPVWIYGIPGTPGMFKVGHLSAPPAGGLNEAWLTRAREALKVQVAPAAVEEDHFRVGKKIAVVRFTVRNESMVLVRVLCQVPRHPTGMVDFLLSGQDHARLERAIESTIGALAPL
jgi:hypothetical protein